VNTVDSMRYAIKFAIALTASQASSSTGTHDEWHHHEWPPRRVAPPAVRPDVVRAWSLVRFETADKGERCPASHIAQSTRQGIASAGSSRRRISSRRASNFAIGVACRTLGAGCRSCRQGHGDIRQRVTAKALQSRPVRDADAAGVSVVAALVILESRPKTTTLRLSLPTFAPKSSVVFSFRRPWPHIRRSSTRLYINGRSRRGGRRSRHGARSRCSSDRENPQIKRRVKAR